MKPLHLHLLALTAMLFGSLTLSARADILYSLVDATDDISFTYDSSGFITSDAVGVSPTTNPSANISSVTFQPDLASGPPPGGTLNDQIATAIGDQVYFWDYSEGVFTSVGTFDSVGADFGEGVLTITEVPEPRHYGLILLLSLIGAMALRKRRQARTALG